jgi:hypothetical protein
MRYIMLLLSVLLLVGCNPGSKEPVRYDKFDSIIDNAKPLAMGDERDIYVFADADNWKAVQPFIQSSIERELILAYPERYFRIVPLQISEVDNFSKHRNLLFIGDLEGNGRVSQYMRKSLADDFINRVQASGGDLFLARNHFSRDQLIMYLMGSNKLNLEKIGAIQSDKIFELLIRRFADRQGYQTYQQKVIPSAFWNAYPFSMQVPDNYTLYSNDTTGRFLSLLYRARMPEREIPDRYINIYYEDMPENKVDHDWLIQKRQMLGEKYFEGDIFDPEVIRKERTQLAGHDAYRIVGAWKNMTHLIGGGFQSYAFWHNGKAYIVDNIVYFPAGDKLPILVELYVISSSLQIK